MSQESEEAAEKRLFYALRFANVQVCGTIENAFELHGQASSLAGL